MPSYITSPPPIGKTYIGMRWFTVSSTYTPTPGTTLAIARGVGGGGGTAGTAAGLGRGGGGAGAYAEKHIANPGVLAVTVGAGGTAGGSGTGGTTSLGTYLIVNGGEQGGASHATFSQGGNAGSVVAGDILTAGAVGANGGCSNALISGGKGADGPWGGGGKETGVGVNSNAGAAPGAGASGSCGAAIGATGYRGVLVIDEYGG